MTLSPMTAINARAKNLRMVHLLVLQQKPREANSERSNPTPPL